MEKILTNSQIVEQLIKLLDIENDNQLAEKLGVERQQINQFKNTKSTRLPQIIITKILEKYHSLEQKQPQSD